MPTGHEFSEDIKQLIFHVIDFVESEKNGPVIPLYNVNERLIKMLNISKSSLTRLKHELNVLREQEAQQEQRAREEEKEGRHLRSRTTPNIISKHQVSTACEPRPKISHRHRSHTVCPASVSKKNVTLSIPQPIPPLKKGE
jgi:hypothetical protein